MQSYFFMDGDYCTREKAETLCSKYSDGLLQVLGAGWVTTEFLKEKAPQIYCFLDSRAIADIVHCAMIDKVKEVFDGLRPKVAILDGLGSLVLSVEDILVIRFKKLDLNLRPHNAKSQQQTNFKQQLIWPDLTNVTVGYKVDKTWEKYLGSYMVCEVGNDIKWKIQLPDIDFGSLAIPDELPIFGSPVIRKKLRIEEVS